MAHLRLSLPCLWHLVLVASTHLVHQLALSRLVCQAPSALQCHCSCWSDLFQIPCAHAHIHLQTSIPPSPAIACSWYPLSCHSPWSCGSLICRSCMLPTSFCHRHCRHCHRRHHLHCSLAPCLLQQGQPSTPFASSSAVSASPQSLSLQGRRPFAQTPRRSKPSAPPLQHTSP